MNNPKELVRILPFPIAWHYRRLLRFKKKSPSKADSIFQDTLEAVLRYLLVFVMSSSLSQLSLVHRQKLQELLKKPSSMGNIFAATLELLKEIEVFRNQKNLIPLYNYFLDSKGKRSYYANLVFELISYRNQLAHNITPTDAQAFDKREVMLNHLDDILNHLTEILPYSLVSIDEQLAKNKVVYLDWTGATPDFIYEETTLSKNISENSENQVFLKTENEMICLSPFVFVEELIDEEKYLFWVFSEADVKGDIFKKLKFSEITEGKEKRILPQSQGIAERLFELFEIFFQNNNFSKEKFTVNEKYYKDQIQLVENLSSTHVEREVPTNSLYNLENIEQSGLLFVEGIAGIGKSSWVAYQITIRNSPHHFCSKQGGRDNVRGMLLSILEQLAEKFSLPIYKETNELYKEFSNYLFDVAANIEKPVFIFIDALDELTDLDNELPLNFLPENLPKNIIFVITSRPIFQNSTNHKQLIKVNLPPVSLLEAQGIAKAHNIQNVSPALLDNCWKLAQGNPFVFLFLIKSAKELPETQTKVQTIDNLILAYIKKAEQTIDAELVYQLISILAVVRELVSPILLSKMVNTRRRTVVNFLRLLSPILLIQGDRVSFAHKLIYDQLLLPDSKVNLEEDELEDAHVLLAKTYLLGEEGILYAEKFAVYHLENSNQLYRLETLLKEVPICKVSLIALAIELAVKNEEMRLKEVCLAILKLPKVEVDKILLEILDSTLDRGATVVIEKIIKDLELENYLSSENMSYIQLKLARIAGNTSEVIFLSKKLISSSGNRLSEKMLNTIYFLQAEALRESGNHKIALDAYHHALTQIKPDIEPHLYFQTSCMLGDLEYVYGRLSAAKQLFNKLVNFSEQHNMLASKGIVFRFQGQIENVNRQFEKAIYLYEKSREIALQVDNKLLLGKIHNSLAESSIPLDLNKAEEHAYLGQEISKSNKALLEYGKSYYLLALIRIMQRDIESCLNLAEKSNNVLTQVNYASGLARIALVKGYALYFNGEFDMALSNFIFALEYYIREDIYPSLRAEALKAALVCSQKNNQVERVNNIECFDNIPYQNEFSYNFSQTSFFNM